MFKSIGLLLIGFVCGWLSYSTFIHNDISSDFTNKIFDIKKSNKNINVFNKTPSVGDYKDAFVVNNNKNSSLVKEIKPENNSSYKKIFSQYLYEKQFDSAVKYYQEIDFSFPDKVSELKKILESTLIQYTQNQEEESFTALTQNYLEVYYGDIDVLILLAKFNASQNYMLEAVNIYQQSYLYANKPIEKTKIEKAFGEYVEVLTKRLESEKNYIELQQLYEHIILVDMADSEKKFYLASLYAKQDNIYDAKNLLYELAEIPSWEKKAKSLLASLNDEGDENKEDPFDNVFDEKIALKKQGSHYIAPVKLSTFVDVNLMLDTGASITTLSQSVFERIQPDINAEKIESRLFRTANGVARGEVYRVYDNTFGRFDLPYLDIAVLNYPANNGVDGLLGMNILSQFRFQLDQEAAELILQKRSRQ